MYRRVVLVFAVAALVALGALQARAVTFHTTSRSFTIKGTATIVTGAGIGGACSDLPYADQCASLDCQCASFTDGTISGALGSGSAAVDASVDIDNGTISGSTDGCNPIFGEVDVTITKPAKSVGTGEILINGTVCHHIINSGPDIIQGGFSTTTCFDGNGAGSGTVNRSTGAFALKFKGPFTTPCI